MAFHPNVADRHDGPAFREEGAGVFSPALAGGGVVIFKAGKT